MQTEPQAEKFQIRRPKKWSSLLAGIGPIFPAELM